MKFQNIINYEQKPGKKFTQPSQTIPDQSLSVRTILERYASGLPINGSKSPIFEQTDEPTKGINPRTLDLVDIQQMQIDNKEEIERLKQQAQDEIQAKKDKKRQEQEDKEHLDFINSLKK